MQCSPGGAGSPNQRERPGGHHFDRLNRPLQRKLLARRAGFFGKPEVEFTTAMVALTVLVIAGFLASLMPAAKAAGVNPIVALQDE